MKNLGKVTDNKDTTTVEYVAVNGGNGNSGASDEAIAEINRKLEILLNRTQQDSQEVSPLDNLILSGAFTAEPTLSNINWIWSSDKIGKTLQIMLHDPEHKKAFEYKTNLASIFGDDVTRKILVNDPPIMNTAMRSRGIKLLFLKDINVVIEMLKSTSACNYILEDSFAITQILNTPEDFNKFWAAYQSDIVMRNNILQSEHPYLANKLNKDPRILEYLLNYESGTNYLAYNQIFSDPNAVATLVTANKLKYNYMELTSILQNPANIPALSGKIDFSRFASSDDERVHYIAMCPNIMRTVIKAQGVSAGTKVEDELTKWLKNTTIRKRLLDNYTAFSIVLEDNEAMNKLKNIPEAYENALSRDDTFFNIMHSTRAFTNVCATKDSWDKIMNIPIRYERVLRDAPAYSILCNSSVSINSVLSNKDTFATLRSYKDVWNKFVETKTSSACLASPSNSNSLTAVLESDEDFDTYLNSTEGMTALVKESNSFKQTFVGYAGMARYQQFLKNNHALDIFFTDNTVFKSWVDEIVSKDIDFSSPLYHLIYDPVAYTEMLSHPNSYSEFIGNPNVLKFLLDRAAVGTNATRFAKWVQPILDREVCAKQFMQAIDQNNLIIGNSTYTEAYNRIIGYLMSASTWFEAKYAKDTAWMYKYFTQDISTCLTFLFTASHTTARALMQNKDLWSQKYNGALNPSRKTTIVEYQIEKSYAQLAGVLNYTIYQANNGLHDVLTDSRSSNSTSGNMQNFPSAEYKWVRLNYNNYLNSSGNYTDSAYVFTNPDGSKYTMLYLIGWKTITWHNSGKYRRIDNPSSDAPKVTTADGTNLDTGLFIDTPALMDDVCYARCDTESGDYMMFLNLTKPSKGKYVKASEFSLQS